MGIAHHAPSQVGKEEEEGPFHKVSEVISWFIKIDLETNFCSYSRTQKLRNGFL